ncbi:MAG: hypothetical protein NTX25_05510, partial [Proteobacteria bacterium]|nr:hypothetical protein [Pseudomonadota bacterium]
FLALSAQSLRHGTSLAGTALMKEVQAPSFVTVPDLKVLHAREQAILVDSFQRLFKGELKLGEADERRYFEQALRWIDGLLYQLPLKPRQELLLLLHAFDMIRSQLLREVLMGEAMRILKRFFSHEQLQSIKGWLSYDATNLCARLYRI